MKEPVFEVRNGVGYRLERTMLAKTPFFSVVNQTGYKKEEKIYISPFIDRIPVLAIDTGAFAGCENLKEVVLPEGIIEIRNNAFVHSGLESMIIPNTVMRIGSQAFAGCKKLKNIKFGSGLEFIFEDVFRRCSALQNVELPKSLLCLSTSAFADCKHLETITFMGDPTTIYDKTNVPLGHYCPNLKNIITNPENIKYKSIDGVLYDMKEKMLLRFPPNSDIKIFVLPKWVEKIHNDAFNYAINFKAIKIRQDTLSGLDKSGLSGCSVKIYCPLNSDVDKWARKNDMDTASYGLISEISDFINTLVDENKANDIK